MVPAALHTESEERTESIGEVAAPPPRKRVLDRADRASQRFAVRPFRHPPPKRDPGPDRRLYYQEFHALPIQMPSRRYQPQPQSVV